jgi:hydrogenase maturation protein HypF
MYLANSMERLTHFDYFNWLAGDKMSQEPRLSFLSLADHNAKEVLNKKFSQAELGIYNTLKKTNKLKTSSVGRLFDAVASLLNICDVNTYEGEAAILLENIVLNIDLKLCRAYCSVGDALRIPTEELWKNLYADFLKGVKKETIISNFLFTLATIILEIAKSKNYKKIALSGGVFQNTTLIDMIKEMSGNQFQLYFNRNLAPNDENISYGQIMYYLNCMQGNKV